MRKLTAQRPPVAAEARRFLLAILGALADLDRHQADQLLALLVVLHHQLLTTTRAGAEAAAGFVFALVHAILIAPHLTRVRRSSPRRGQQPASAPHQLTPATPVAEEPAVVPFSPAPEPRPAQLTQPPEPVGGAKGREEKLAVALDLLARGQSQRAVARELGVPRSTLRGWLGRQTAAVG
jgi:Homeodomain-like domain